MEEARSLTTSNLITFRGGPLKFQIARMTKLGNLSVLMQPYNTTHTPSHKITINNKRRQQ